MSMSDQKRLVNSSPNAFTRQLLEAGLRDRPRAASFDAVAAGVGLGVRDVMASEVDGLHNAGGGLNAATQAPVAGTLAASAAKWLAIGVLAGGAVSGGSVAVERVLREEPSRVAGVPARPHAPGPTAPRSIISGLDARAPELGPSLPALDAPPRQATGRASARRAGSAALAAAAVSASETARVGKDHTDTPRDDALAEGALAREAAWIDAARRAIEQGELARATSALDDYDRERRVGVLNREALVLRVEVALRQRDFARARVLTERFAATYPGDPHVARLRALSTSSAAQ
jgi:hypothetical protein